MSYKNNEIMRLDLVKELNINPAAILDVGAHTGQFYSWAKPVWPNAIIWMIEANHLHDNTLKELTKFTKDEYLITALGDSERDVTFYTRKDKPWTEGNSYYKEHNYWDIPQLVEKNNIKLQTLDELFDENSFFELIKIDTQGSELDIIKGGYNICKKAKAIILEISYIEYNEGAPNDKEIVEFMNNFGFEEKMSLGEHYDGEQIIQKDILFLNKTLV